MRGSIAIYSALLAFSASAGNGLAHAAEPFFDFSLAGQNWSIPSAYMTSQTAGPQRNFRLSFSLPNFQPLAQGDDKADILTAIIAETQGNPGQALFKQLMSQAETNCMTCVGDNAIGGKTYSNYATGPVPSTIMPDKPPYNLYVRQTANGPWFAVCFFQKDLKPLPCEVEENLRPGLTLTYIFKPEYMSRALDFDSFLRALLAAFQIPSNSENINKILDTAAAPLQCWAPPGGSDNQVFSLTMGNKVWSIPVQYAETAGGENKDGKTVTGFGVFLKLPNLVPLTPDDPSPFTIHGSGQYTNLSIDYNAIEMFRKFTAPNTSGLASVINGSEESTILPILRETKANAFDDFDEYSDGMGDDWFISHNSERTRSSFPPDVFSCDRFSPGRDAGCIISVSIPSDPQVQGEPLAGYEISFLFARDYFSQLASISQCVAQLYRRLSGT